MLRRFRRARGVRPGSSRHGTRWSRQFHQLKAEASAMRWIPDRLGSLLTTPWRRFPRTAEAVVVFALLTAHFLLAATSVRTKGPTFDEVFHLAKGVTFWQTGDFRMAGAHPTFAPLWATLPLLRSPPALPPCDGETWVRSDLLTYCYRLFWTEGNDVQAMLWPARAMIALLSVALGLAVYVWSRRLFGAGGGLLSLALYAFSPSMLAHARLVTTDMAVTAFFLLAAGSVWWVFHRVTPLSLLGSSLALTGLFISKLTAVVVFPVLLGAVVVRVLSATPVLVRCRSWERGIASRQGKASVLLAILAVNGLVIYTGIWASYGFRYSPFAHALTGEEQLASRGGKDCWALLEEKSGPTLNTVVGFCRDHKLFPEMYLCAVSGASYGSQMRVSFLDGEHSLTGFRRFFPLCFLYKTPAPSLVLLACALAVYGGTLVQGMCGEERRLRSAVRALWGGVYRTAPLWLLLATYWFVLVSSKLNIGHRHMLPVYPPLFVLAGAAFLPLRGALRWLRWVGPAVVLLGVAASLRTYPHYLAYFNCLAGGPRNGHRHLVDSSLDWGQDLPGLAAWLRENAQGRETYVAYFGYAPPAYYGIEARQIPYDVNYIGPTVLPRIGDPAMQAPRGGIYCISATLLEQVYPPALFGHWTEAREEAYRRWLPVMRRFQGATSLNLALDPSLRLDWASHGKQYLPFACLQFGRLCHHLRQREPDTHIGHSILIYELTDEDVRQMLYVAK